MKMSATPTIFFVLFCSIALTNFGSALKCKNKAETEKGKVDGGKEDDNCVEGDDHCAMMHCVKDQYKLTWWYCGFGEKECNKNETIEKVKDQHPNKPEGFKCKCKHGPKNVSMSNKDFVPDGGMTVRPLCTLLAWSFLLGLFLPMLHGMLSGGNSLI